MVRPLHLPIICSWRKTYSINNQSKMEHRLWFDVEEEYGTTKGEEMTIGE